ncbi:MAG: threonylcarbamoyl-AMP synthase [Lachnospiraceae bacterium]|nr:threonylcarbamoyl-AMP synthase [Lachnospiraceae bacterium]
MVTEICKMTEENIDEAAIERAGRILRGGGLVAFPTETVYGLGGDALQSRSSEKIYAAKGRPSDNPLIVHVCDMKDVERIVKKIPDTARKLADAFWPGPLTMIMEKTDAVPKETTGGLDTVAIRMPENKIALALIRAAGGYIAAPSANTSGRPSPTLAEHVTEDMDGKVEMIIDGGAVGIGLESTIVDLTEEEPIILRPGYITQEMLTEALRRDVEVDRTILDANSGQAPKAPGMKYRHYAPKADLTVFAGDPEAVTEKIRACVREDKKNGRRVGIICTDETKAYYMEADEVESVGKRSDAKSIAHGLFAVLRDFDKRDVDVIYSEAFSRKGIGQAIMNRLLKAAGHHVIKVNTKEEGKTNDSDWK